MRRPRQWPVALGALNDVADHDADVGHPVHDADPGVRPALREDDEGSASEVVRLPARRQVHGSTVGQNS